MPKDKEIEPIAATLNEVSTAVLKSTRAIKTNKNKGVSGVSLVLPAPIQQNLFRIEKQVEFDGIEMGVLENGIPYLSESGLARMCGIDRKTIYELSTNWPEEKLKPRGRQINQLLEQAGYFEPILYLKSENNGIPTNAYTEPVCMALLEYYAFISNDKKDSAINAFRILAKRQFRNFIYDAVGYSPDHKVLDSWRHFHDRIDMTMDSVPDGYFSIFREIAIMIVPMIRAGIIISDRVVPDISVGKAWSTYWSEQHLSETHGDRTRYDHEYPLYYPQAKSNPQPSFAYPESSLGEFRAWLRQHYITNKFPNYLLGQIKKGTVPVLTANKAIEAFSGKFVEDKSK